MTKKTARKKNRAKTSQEEREMALDTSIILERATRGSVALEGREQPRGVSQEGDQQDIRPYYKAGMELELQKFGNPKISQLLLGEDADIQQETGFISGVNLTKPQERALHAIQKLLDETDYGGNLPGEERTSIDFHWRGHIPTLSFTPTEYFQAYELKPAGDGRYRGKSAQEAIEGLKSLMTVRHFVVYDRITYKNGKKLREAIRVTTPLITAVGEAFQNITEEELEQVRAGKELSGKRNTKIVITPSPLLLDGITNRNWYLMKPSTLFSEIQELNPGKKYPNEVHLFIDWLLTLDMKSFNVSRDTLAIRLKMDKLIEHRRRSEINRRIDMALEVALELKYLLSYDVQPTGLIKLELNPERVKRIEMKRRGRKKASKETE